MYHDRAQFSVLFIETNLAVTTKKPNLLHEVL